MYSIQVEELQGAMIDLEACYRYRMDCEEFRIIVVWDQTTFSRSSTCHHYYRPHVDEDTMFKINDVSVIVNVESFMCLQELMLRCRKTLLL